LLYASKVLAKLTPANDDQKVGVDIVRRALQTPVRQIAENAGVDGSIVIGKLQDKGDANYGYDAQAGEYVDMLKAGIIDPTKVVRLALQDAASVGRAAGHHRGHGGGEARAEGRSGNAARRRHGWDGLLIVRAPGRTASAVLPFGTKYEPSFDADRRSDTAPIHPMERQSRPSVERRSARTMRPSSSKISAATALSSPRSWCAKMARGHYCARIYRQPGASIAKQLEHVCHRAFCDRTTRAGDEHVGLLLGPGILAPVLEDVGRQRVSKFIADRDDAGQGLGKRLVDPAVIRVVGPPVDRHRRLPRPQVEVVTFDHECLR
jgi:hypothetical protein